MIHAAPEPVTFPQAVAAIKRQWRHFPGTRVGFCSHLPNGLRCEVRIPMEVKVGWQPWQHSTMKGTEDVTLRGTTLVTSHLNFGVGFWVTLPR